jgi:plasmid maintenance system antidote protein VapI
VPVGTDLAIPDTASVHDGSCRLLTAWQRKVKGQIPSSEGDGSFHVGYVFPMATRDDYLFIKEWMRHLEISDDELANRLHVSRGQIWKWCNEQQRLNPQKIGRIARVMGIRPEQLWCPPLQPDLNALISDVPEELQITAQDIVRRLVGHR